MLLKQFHSQQRLYFVLLIGAFLGALYFLGWGEFVSVICWDDAQTPSRWQLAERANQFREFLEHNREPLFLPGRQLILLAPFLIALVCSWGRFYDGDKTVYQIDSCGEPPSLGRLAYLDLQVRFNLLLIGPLLVLNQIRDLFLWILPSSRHGELLDPGFFMALLALLCMPWVLRLFLRLHSLPPGPLRRASGRNNPPSKVSLHGRFGLEYTQFLRQCQCNWNFAVAALHYSDRSAAA